MYFGLVYEPRELSEVHQSFDITTTVKLISSMPTSAGVIDGIFFSKLNVIYLPNNRNPFKKAKPPPKQSVSRDLRVFKNMQSFSFYIC